MPRAVTLRALIGVVAAVLLLTAAVLEFTHRSPNAPAPPAGAAKLSARARADFARLPLQFEANAGQADTRVRFLSRGPGYAVFLGDRDATVALRGPATGSAAPASKAVRMQLRGSREDARVAGESP